MTKYKNPRELEEENEDNFAAIDEEAKNDKATPKEKEKEVNWEKRYSDLRRHQIEQENNYKSRLAEAQRQIEGFRTGTLRPPKTEEEIESWRAQFPEFGDVLESWIKKDVGSQVDAATKPLRQKISEITREKAILELKGYHPDLDSVFDQNSGFFDWLGKQSERDINIITNSFDVKSAASIINQWKNETGKGDKSRGDSDDYREAARSVRTRAKPEVNSDSDGYLFSESQIIEMDKKDPKWWDANEEKILNAQRQGKILMDVTGGAR